MHIVISRPPSSGSLTELHQQINIGFECLPVLPTPPTPRTTREYCSNGLFEESLCLEAVARLVRLLDESYEHRDGKGILPCGWTTALLILLLLWVLLSWLDRSFVALVERLLCRLERENVPRGKPLKCCCCCSLMMDAAKKRFVASRSLLDIEILVGVKYYSSGHCHMIWKLKPSDGKWMQ